MQGDRSSRDVLLTLTLLDALLWRHRPLPLLCACSVHIGRLHRSRRPAGRSYKSRRALCAHGARCPASKGVRPPSPRCSRRPHRTFIYYTALAIVQGDHSSRDALVVRSRCSMPFFGVRPPPSLCALAVHIGRLLYRYIAFAIVQGDRFSRSVLNPVQYWT